MTSPMTTDHANQLGLLDTIDSDRNILQELVDAVCFLASVCDGAHSHDGQGFNGRDANFGRAMSDRILDGQTLTPNMIRSIGKMLQTYKKQLTQAGMPLPSLPLVHAYLAALVPVAPEAKQAITFGPSAQKGWVSVKFPYALLDAFKAAVYYKDRAWDKHDKTWYVRDDQVDVIKKLAN
jgi:hypothetical protein